MTRECLWVSLGRSAFELRGLSAEQRNELSRSWGPFIRSKSLSEGATSEEATHPIARWGRALEEWIIEFRVGRARSHRPPDYYREHDLYLYDLSDQRSSAEEPRHIESWIDGSLGAIEATIQVALQWSLQSRGGLLVHASAGVYQGRGVLIPGPSGAGKSTAAREAGFDVVLSDEMVIVEEERGHERDHERGHRYALYSTPFWSEGRSLPLVISSAPLSLIAIPHKSEQARLISCTESVAVSYLLRAITVYSDQTHDMELKAQVLTELFELTCRLCAAVSYATLAFPKRGPWLSQLEW